MQCKLNFKKRDRERREVKEGAFGIALKIEKRNGSEIKREREGGGGGERERERERKIERCVLLLYSYNTFTFEINMCNEQIPACYYKAFSFKM